jgi:membrane-bound lytic murein transglycosylase D
MNNILKGLFYLIFFAPSALSAQAPQVPSRLNFGGLMLEIDAQAKAEIQADVDRMHRSPRYFETMIDRVNLYFPIIERVFREEGLPEDFKYLAIQESALVSDAVSVSNAVGFWQFKMASGQEVGLRVDRQIDERAHIEAATRGAARYLKRNNQSFDNWLYTLLSYNVGLGGALSIIDKKYYGARNMPVTKSTHWYVKKFLAHKIAYEPFLGKKSHPEMALYSLQGRAGQSLNQIAAEYQINPQTLYDYNKWLKTERIPDDKMYQVLLPVSHDNRAALAKLQGRVEPQTAQRLPSQSTTKSNPKPDYGLETQKRFIERKGLQAVIGQKGDEVKELAKWGGISKTKFRRYNELLRKEPIKGGMVYYYEKKNRKGESPYHVVQSGEGLWDVSQIQAIRLNRLIRLNRIDPAEPLQAGRKLHLQKRIKKNQKPEFVPLSSPKSPNVLVQQSNTTSSPTYEPYTRPEEVHSYAVPIGFTEVKHTVQRGESYFSVAAKYGVSVDNLLIWNNANAAQPLAAGKVLVMYVDPNRKVLPKGDPSSYYEVQPGDTLYGITRKFGIGIEQLRELNDLKSDTIHPGQKLRIKL